jgi:hypothetical protein
LVGGKGGGGGLFGEATDDFLALWGAKVGCGAALVAGELAPPNGRAVVVEEAPRPQRVASFWVLHLHRGVGGLGWKYEAIAFTTSAPKYAKYDPTNGAAISWPTSTTLRDESAFMS